MVSSTVVCTNTPILLRFGLKFLQLLKFLQSLVVLRAWTRKSVEFLKLFPMVWLFFCENDNWQIIFKKQFCVWKKFQVSKGTRPIDWTRKVDTSFLVSKPSLVSILLSVYASCWFSSCLYTFLSIWMDIVIIHHFSTQKFARLCLSESSSPDLEILQVVRTHSWQACVIIPTCI